MIHAGGGGVMLWGIFCGTLCLFSTNWENATAYCWPSFYEHSSSDGWLHHVKKLKSSQTYFLIMKISSLYSNSHQIPIHLPVYHLWDLME